MFIVSHAVTVLFKLSSCFSVNTHVLFPVYMYIVVDSQFRRISVTGCNFRRSILHVSLHLCFHSIDIVVCLSPRGHSALFIAILTSLLQMAAASPYIKDVLSSVKSSVLSADLVWPRANATFHSRGILDTDGTVADLLCRRAPDRPLPPDRATSLLVSQRIHINVT